MNDFKDYVTSSAFNLSLSKNMIEFLLHISDPSREAWHLSYWCAAEKACERRGLSKRVPLVQRPDHSKAVLTEAGELTVKMLNLAGFELPNIDKEAVA